ncbi:MULTISPECIES: TetR/AcrR family transcriptional regulator [Pseudonocardia]|uniref:TetR family transcriptional regulator n=2 Tax=Pseudonocardia TaxID=1847 RepID=A0ABQ0RVS4_9PSEU|nr:MULTISPECIES: TetR/AcrR family transcriptional regulator [Pseudonocardia]OSY40718.1 putative HTH-type transcriptional regulator TtgW [Pseudonocardia autotrophica]TDN71975.1 TetR family transcriptional regulator [Pseudonocardia autotrophica]BBG02662.1 TetR family transcriptional regulator [Pseudonocardia autotrophica]GEC24721.1 TetR family transcriptional regulator [Pseudonocardia saturnea]
MATRGEAAAHTPPTRLRADARRNRERVLEAADEVFSETGPTASTEEVARRAGVAIGTVFRHFPTKELLIEAVVVGRLTQLTVEAEQLGEAADADAAFVSFFHRWVELSATKHQFSAALARSGTDVQDVKDTNPEVVERLYDAIGGLLRRAQRADRIRQDLTVPDVVALMGGASWAHEQAGPDPERRARLLSVAISGLRPSGP